MVKDFESKKRTAEELITEQGSVDPLVRVDSFTKTKFSSSDEETELEGLPESKI